MKTTPTQYARALFEAVEGKQQPEADAIIARFAERLRQDRQIGKLAAIVDAFSALWNKEHGIVEATVTSRARLDDAALADVKRFIMQRYHAQQVTIIDRIDMTIKGGIIIRVGDEVIDGSIATQLKKLKKNLIATGAPQS